jgi:parallel beta-helix repeat protein
MAIPRFGVILALATAVASTAQAGSVVVHPGQSIQAAIDAAAPGATIVVQPGTYREAGATRALTITKPGIHLIGQSRRGRPVVLEQSGTQTQGIWVSPTDTLDPADVEQPPCGVSNNRLAGFDVRGFTVQGFSGFGIYLACVDSFNIRNNTARANLTYAIFPVRSRRGHMTGNTVSGTLSDACLYVGQDDSIVVQNNHASDCLIGLQIENSTNIRYTGNVSEHNTAGMIVDILNGRQVKVVSNNRVEHNVFRDNNRPNSAPPSEDTSQILPGIGLIVVGAHRTLIQGNTFSGNKLAATTLTDFCFGMPDACNAGLDIDPNPDNNRYLRNTFENNGTDVIYMPGKGKGNCFSGNRPASLTVIGGPLPSCH